MKGRGQETALELPYALIPTQREGQRRSTVSRTPETVRNKSAEKFRNFLVVVGLFAGLLSWGAFDAGNDGNGLIFAIVCGALLWIASKVRTVRHKTGEVGVYQ